MEYAVATMLLLNMIVDAAEKDIKLRAHIRAQLIASGFKQILTKMEKFQY
jgi:cytokinesis protein